ncbi:CAP domain-containing protein [Blastococcus goldschmidtiae]|uniref:CAP domain-containing protein n=1 Tax=Blastococcus goldschmidtiae TaxID=3075546 RepID=A0ABU2K8Q2_9ACTN|nr:CAP domain-containing protein [Blastococcus sp. DSM 46792]MDT0276572.1 CAP domain-containing protein [Blastococcus sp. DSM 46792]
MSRTRPALLALLLVLLATTGCVVVQNGSVGAVATAPAPGTPPGDGPDGPAEERMARALFDRVNAEREARGLGPVAWDGALAEVAADWSEAMAGTGVLEHQDMRSLLDRDELDGFSGVGENIFTASGPVPAGVAHVGWMRSDGHRANVLNPGWNRLGIGVFCAPDGSTWATQQFGRTIDADRAQVSDATPPTEPIARPEEDGPSCG